VPAASPAGATLTLSDCGALPEEGVTVNHGASSEPVKLSAPLPVLVTLSV
jgi:hypothetical protein